MIGVLVSTLFAFVGITTCGLMTAHRAVLCRLKELAATLACLEDRLEALERLAYGVRCMPRLTQRRERVDG